MDENPRSLRDAVLSQVRSVGFDRVGCLPLADAGDLGVRAWVDAGYHGTMGWMERHVEAKERPQQAFPHHHSVVVAALEYGEVAPTPAPSIGNVSRYALGDDYHEVLKARLRRAAESVASFAPALRPRIFVDTGPLNEKLIATRAGLGWVGRHTNLISRGRGSYQFLGLILVAPLWDATGPTAADRCGRCTACLPACPTGAIVAPYRLDARRCLSYLTIEHEGPIPIEFRAAFGNRIFGCDDCQEVCPWNRFARRNPEEPFRPREGLRDTPLTQWLELDEAEFERRFAGSAVLRAGHSGFLRNVLVALGSVRPDAGLAGVLRFAAHPSPLLRAHAAWALGRYGAEDALRDRAFVEDAPEVREEIELARKEISRKTREG